MILTGGQIAHGVAAGRIQIDPYDAANLEPNSYGFHLGREVMVYTNAVVDGFSETDTLQTETLRIPEEGMVLYPDRFYLSHTRERIGSHDHASELYARLSTSLAGIFIQTSAPLGHTGAIIPWTLEITVAHAVRVYAGMPIGKICFWCNYGKIRPYDGRYKNSESVVHSRIEADRHDSDRQ